MKWILALALLILSTMPVKADEGVTRFGIGAPVMIANGYTYWGGNLSVLHGVSSNLDLGLETGFHTHSEGAASLWVIPVMPTLLYNFDAGSSFHPFIGMGLGIGIVHLSISGFGMFGSIGATNVEFEGLAHIGAKFGEGKNFFADMKLGLLDSTFIFLPTIGWFF